MIPMPPVVWTHPTCAFRYCCIYIICIWLLACTARAQSYISVMAYNCENAFDTIHDAGHSDYDFLPDGANKWSRYRMHRKLRNIAQVIAATDTSRPVDIVGLCEVENDSVLTWLTRQSALAPFRYNYIMTDSPDQRGIDVAILYSRFTVFPIYHEYIRHPDPKVRTRDILHLSAEIATGDTLDVFMLHLPSKTGGQSAARNRTTMLRTLRCSIDTILTSRPDARIIIMGDFNSSVRNTAIEKILGCGTLHRKNKKLNKAKRPQPILTDLTEGNKPGTYKYRGQWSCIDHIIVSRNLLDADTRLHTSAQHSGICSNPFLLETDPNHNGNKPFRTYLGNHYHGGYSDHLPVWARFIIRK